MEHKQFIEELQSRLGKDKKEIDNLFSDMLQILKDRCGQMDTLSIQGFGTFEPRKKNGTGICKSGNRQANAHSPQNSIGF